jgi:hypothetical protein
MWFKAGWVESAERSRLGGTTLQKRRVIERPQYDIGKGKQGATTVEDRGLDFGQKIKISARSRRIISFREL